MNFKNKRAEILNGKISLSTLNEVCCMFTENDQDIQNIVGGFFQYASTFQCKWRNCRQGPRARRKMWVYLLEQFICFYSRNIFSSIFKLNLKLQPVFMNISDCMVFIIKKKSVLIYVINGKTFGQRKTNFWQCNDKISMWILNTFIWWE